MNELKNKQMDGHWTARNIMPLPTMSGGEEWNENLQSPDR